jgi:hypothetical protein
MVHADGRDGPDFRVALFSTRAAITKPYESMCMGMRSEHLRYAATLGGGEVPDSELDKCASHPVHNNGGIGFPLDRNKDGTPVLRNHQMLESVPKHRAMYL